MQPKVLVTRKLPQEALELLRGRCHFELNEQDVRYEKPELIERLQGKEGVICLLTDRMDADVLGAYDTLKIICNVAVGFDNVDLAEATRRGIAVTNTPGVLTETTADLAWALLMACARRICEGDRFVRAGLWREWRQDLFLGQDVHGSTLGLVGLGRIGRAMAQRARGFAMRVLYTDVQGPNPDVAHELSAQQVDLDTLLREADFVSLHLPLAADTRHFIGERELGLMKPTACLINTSRGPVVDEASLVRALRTGTIAGAGLDVFEQEPRLSAGLAELENVVLLPHIGSASVATRTRMATMAAENLVAFLQGERPPNLVNPEVLDQ